MSDFSIKELKEMYDFDLDKIADEINKNKFKKVLLQFADGLKPYSVSVVDYLKEKTNNKTEFIIWFGSCYGACDIPILPKDLEKQIDFFVQFGHNEMMPDY